MTTGRDRTDQHGKIIVITGASSGIGAAAARRLARAGAIVVPVGRSPERTRAMAAELGTEPVVADFAHLDQVSAAAETLLDRYPRIDVLVNNAGGIFPRRVVTQDGNELTFQVNHLAGFLLTNLLLDRLRDSAAGRQVRVISTSSFGNRFARVRLDDLQWQRRRYGNGWIPYCATKLMNIMFTTELARRTDGTGIVAACFHPDPGRNAQPVAAGTRDAVPTNFGRETSMMRLYHRIPVLRDRQLSGARGCQPLVWLASTPQVLNGWYYNGFEPSRSFNKQGKDPDLAERLWSSSLELVAPYL